MANVVIVGAQWGDEGKAKVIDLLAEEADVVIRYQGGCNAGHTVKYKDDVFKFHLIPSGMLYQDALCIIGPGTVIDPDVLIREIEDLEAKGYSTTYLKVSSRAHLTLPYHVAVDKAREETLSKDKIGTTGKGIGPTYIDKIARFGIRLGDLYESETVLKEKITRLLTIKNPILEKGFGLVPETVEDLYTYCRACADKLKPYVTDTLPLVHDAIARGDNLLFEGAQGTLLDIDYGTYPFVTSSNPTAGGACTGSGVGPTAIDRVIGVMKAYTTRVGSGPFPTELTDDMGKHLVEVGQEFGTTTGRMRRCGWFDAVIGKYSVQVNGLDGVAITKLDVLDGVPEIKLCVAYRDIETGETLTQFPDQLARLDRLEPVYETMPGWQGSVKEARRYEDLPEAARKYLERMSALIGCPAVIVSVGPERNQTILLENPMKSGKRGFPQRKESRKEQTLMV